MESQENKQVNQVDDDNLEVKENKSDSVPNSKNEIRKDNIQKMVLLFKAIHTMNIMKTDNKPVKILDKLYIGSVGAANNKDELKNIGITHIVTAASTLKCLYPEDFTYLKLDVLDSPEVKIKDYFHKTGEFINEAIEKYGGVFVHCHAGISRSSTIIMAYMISHKGYSFSDALKHCKSQREKINPNEGFRKQLEEHERKIRDRENEDKSIKNIKQHEDNLDNLKEFIIRQELDKNDK